MLPILIVVALVRIPFADRVVAHAKDAEPPRQRISEVVRARLDSESRPETAGPAVVRCRVVLFAELGAQSRWLAPCSSSWTMKTKMTLGIVGAFSIVALACMSGCAVEDASDEGDDEVAAESTESAMLAESRACAFGYKPVGVADTVDNNRTCLAQIVCRGIFTNRSYVLEEIRCPVPNGGSCAARVYSRTSTAVYCL